MVGSSVLLERLPRVTYLRDARYEVDAEDGGDSGRAFAI